MFFHSAMNLNIIWVVVVVGIKVNRTSDTELLKTLFSYIIGVGPTKDLKNAFVLLFLSSAHY
jgi:hypothetical protein